MKFRQQSLCTFAALLSHLVLVCPALGQEAVIREAEAQLHQHYAMFRSTQISEVNYQVSINVEAGSDEFSGTSQISFEVAAGNSSPLTVDFDSGDIIAVSLNGNTADWEYSQWFISLPPAQFSTGANELVITFRRPFTQNGDGLHKFTDQENGEEYLYTNFEPYSANRFFPMFDQPNLKATFTLEVLVPESWQVISNMAENNIQTEGNRKRWQFPPTLALSTYLYAFHAGPFTVWEEQAGAIQMRLFARNSLAEFVDTQEWFIPTRQLLNFFQNYYDVPYPLSKYDQIVVPDFNAGAMENMGAVTFNERYISRGAKDNADLFRLTYVIAHEMAHMWFGDIVTMEWWDDLWLNESFATYMGYLGTVEATEFTNAWDIFYSSGKASAYRADDLVTTHPVSPGNVLTTSDAFSSFDTITYQKGSALLKQLPYFIGEENFRQGVSNYIKEHSYANASLDDLVDSLADSANLDLSRWKQEWLQTSGANTLRAQFSCKNERITEMRLVQSVPGIAVADKVLRSQRTLVGLYRYTDDTMVLGNAIPVTYKGAVTWIPEAVGEPCPDMVFPNENDHAYLVIDLDPISRSTLREHINDFSSATTRLMLWESLWSSVRNAAMPLNEFVDFAVNNIGEESDDLVVRQVSGNLRAAFNYYNRFGGHKAMRESLQNFAWNALESAEPGSEIQQIWYSSFVNLAHTKEALNALQSMLTGNDSIPVIEIDQDKRWDIIVMLNRYLHEDYEALLTAEMTMDPSDLGMNSALAATASRPQASVKAAFLNSLINEPDRYKVANQRYIASYLFENEQHELIDMFADQIFAAWSDWAETAEDRFMNVYQALLPTRCDEGSIARFESAVQTWGQYRQTVSRPLLTALQDMQRCVRVRALVE
ncbi:MAG: aminopeptidase N [Gammaproteobacteria bacterium]|nr:aminopeptidase N [Gammaproteobacteria bacterium]